MTNHNLVKFSVLLSVYAFSVLSSSESISFHAPTPRTLPPRRTRFVASTNGGSSSFQPLADLLLSQKSSWNVASAYCSSPGEVSNSTVLPEPPFCYNNWTVPIRTAAPEIYQMPIIQLLGNSGPDNFKHPYIFATLYVNWAIKYNFDGYLIDAEFKGDDAAYVAFLNVFADALHQVNKTLGVFLYPDMGKAPYVNTTTIDMFTGAWAGKCSTVPDFIWGLKKYHKADLMLYQSDAKCDGTGIETIFSTLNQSSTAEIGFWANGADMGASWYTSMAAWITNPNEV